MKQLTILLVFFLGFVQAQDIPIDAKYWISDNAYLQPRKGKYDMTMGLTGFKKVDEKNYEIDYRLPWYDSSGNWAEPKNKADSAMSERFWKWVLSTHQNGDITTWGKLTINESIPAEPPVEIVSDTIKVVTTFQKDTTYTITYQRTDFYKVDTVKVGSKIEKLE